MIFTRIYPHNLYHKNKSSFNLFDKEEVMEDVDPEKKAPNRTFQGAMANLTHDELVATWKETLDSPRRNYRIDAKILFKLLDLIYGKERTLSKYKVLELIARVPYQSWEQVSYIAITHTYEKTEFARGIFNRVLESRNQQDNEQWHLLILEDLIAKQQIREGKIKYWIIPQAIAFVYYQLSWLLYVMRPKWSYRLNADFEDHAQHEYALLVKEHPEWEELPFDSDFANDYARLESLADLFRQISYDEKIHKDESIEAIGHPRFP